MNWAFIIAVASWSILERFLRNESETRDRFYEVIHFLIDIMKPIHNLHLV